MGGPAGPEVVVVRTAVRDALRSARQRGDLRDRDLVLVACSGGADSVALAVAAAWVAPRLGLGAGAVVVDHGLQDGSGRVAATAGDACRGLGLHPVEVVRVVVPVHPGGDGPEARARFARHGAFREVAERAGASAILLAHTRDDQAETVLLGLARGSGARALSGMAPDAPLPGSGARLLRPLLSLDRATVRTAAEESGLPVWEDPHNVDPAYARARVRHGALPALQAALGPRAIAALSRTADLLRADAAALDDWAALAYARLAETAVVAVPDPPEAAVTAVQAREGSVPADPPSGEPASGGRGVVELDVAGLSGLPGAVRTRVIMRAARAVGVPAARLTAAHVRAVDALVTDWQRQGAVRLPAGVSASRRCGRLRLSPERAGAAV